MRRSNLLFIVVAFGTLFLDQVTKWWAVEALKGLPFRSPEHNVFTLGGVGLNFSYAENPGATFSFLADVSQAIRLPFFAIIAAAAAIGISVYYTHLKGRRRAARVALGLLWAGAMGNLVDRLRYTYVVDFIDVYYQDWTWPTFNVADIAIVVGILLFFLWGADPEEEAMKEAAKKKKTA